MASFALKTEKRPVEEGKNRQAIKGAISSTLRKKSLEEDETSFVARSKCG